MTSEEWNELILKYKKENKYLKFRIAISDFCRKYLLSFGLFIVGANQYDVILWFERYLKFNKI